MFEKAPIWVLLLGLATKSWGYSTENVSLTWHPADRIPLPIADAQASAALNDDYVARLSCDKNRSSKWVCPVQPWWYLPQWLILQFPQEETVGAVAVFGEDIGNGGIVDADIQVEQNGVFVSVVEIRSATSGNWVATFDPVVTSRVRLLIYNGGDPFINTDVREVEAYSPPVSSDQVQSWSQTCLATAGDLLNQAGQDARFMTRLHPQASLNYANEIGSLNTQAAALATRMASWDVLNSEARTALTAEVDVLGFEAQRWSQLIGATRWARAQTQAKLDDMRAQFQQAFPEANPADEARGKLTEAAAWLGNSQAQVRAGLSDGTLDIAWGTNADVAIIGARGTATIDGQAYDLGGAPAQIQAVQDPLGAGLELRQDWVVAGVRIVRESRAYQGLSAVTLGGRVANESDRTIRLGSLALLAVHGNGAWWVGHTLEYPASLYMASPATAFVSQGDGVDPWFRNTKNFNSSGLLALVARDPQNALVLGFVQAPGAMPVLNADFALGEGGTNLQAGMAWLDRPMAPGEVVELDRLYLAGNTNAFAALEGYGQVLGKFSEKAPRQGATALWCSWYGYRMDMTEQDILTNAEIVAKYFQPLGLETMQVDHGWQKGNLPGDWVPNERFSHGVDWLAGQLRDRFHLKLGLWIAPTVVAETSELFQQHPDWMLEDQSGHPQIDFAWYWEPSPNCYALDPTRPEGIQYLKQTIQNLRAAGVIYFKIDFLSALCEERLWPANPQTARAWPALRQAMKAVRDGAGEEAWIRYCNVPPLAAVGLADGAYGGDDTLDAGTPNSFYLLRENANTLAATYWLNDVAFHRELCDMSVRAQGSDEEVRLRAAMMTLANCSISFSDNLTQLPPERLRLMQQCLPPGNPPMRPLDLFDRDIASLWHIPVRNAAGSWDVVGLFNFNSEAELRTVDFAALGLESGAGYVAWEFWEEKFLGLATNQLQVVLPPQSSRILSLRKYTGQPQLIGTDMHLLQGYHEVQSVVWDADASLLSGQYRRMPGIQGKAFFLLPEGYWPITESALPATTSFKHLDGRVWVQECAFQQANLCWSVPLTNQPPSTPLNRVVINEVLPHNNPPLDGAIELFNPGPEPVSIAGWYLSDDDGLLKKYRLPDHAIIQPGNYYVLFEQQINQTTNPVLRLNFDGSTGGTLFLAATDETGQLTGEIATAAFGPIEDGYSWGRYETGLAVDFVPLGNRTFGMDNPNTREEFYQSQGAPNATPRVGPVVINKIGWAAGTGAAGTLARLQYIELLNRSLWPVGLFNDATPAQTWKLGGAVEYAFPAGVTMPANSRLWVVNFNPQTEPVALAEFQAQHDSSEPVYGPLALGNNHMLTLWQPKPHSTNDPASLLMVDQLNLFITVGPLVAAQTNSLCLLRLQPDQYANVNTNWQVSNVSSVEQNPLLLQPLQIKAILKTDLGVILRFEGVAGQHYTVESRPSLGSGNWSTALTTNLTYTGPAEILLPQTASNTQAWFRIMRSGY